MDMVDLIETRRFLGSEFLMWLWFKSECYDNLFHTEAHGGVEVWIDDKLTLEAYLAETERNDLKGGAPAHSPEAKTALRQGKRVARAKLGVIKEGREWSMTLKTASLDLTGVKLPALLSREEDEQFYERMYLLEELEDILATLYEEFLTIRLDDTWHEHMLPAIRAWIHADSLAEAHHYPAQALQSRLAIPITPAFADEHAHAQQDEDAQDEDAQDAQDASSEASVASVAGDEADEADEADGAGAAVEAAG